MLEVLALLPVDPGPDLQRVRVADLLRRHDPRPQRPVRVERFPHRPGRRLPLPVAHADIVRHRIAGDHLRRPLPRHVPAAPADHERQLPLVINHRRDPRHLDLLVGANHARRLLVEDRRQLRQLPPRLGDVVRIVQSHRQIFARLRHRRRQLHLPQRQPPPALRHRRLSRRQRFRPRGQEGPHLARQIGRGGAQVHHLLVHHHTNAALPTLPKGREFQWTPPSLRAAASRRPVDASRAAAPSPAPPIAESAAIRTAHEGGCSCLAAAASGIAGGGARLGSRSATAAEGDAR